MRNIGVALALSTLILPGCADESNMLRELSCTDTAGTDPNKLEALNKSIQTISNNASTHVVQICGGTFRVPNEVLPTKTSLTVLKGNDGKLYFLPQSSDNFNRPNYSFLTNK